MSDAPSLAAMLSEGLPDPSEKGFNGEQVRAGYELQGDEGTFQSPCMRIPIGDNWDELLRAFALDPNVFEVVDDTVRMSRWQQSARAKDGTRDSITLYSYRGRFRRKSAAVVDDAVSAAMKRVGKWRPRKMSAPIAGTAEPCTFYVGWSDWQLGKEGTLGPDGTIERVLNSFEATAARVKELRRMGRNIPRLAIANMGDPNEGCDGNYSSQLATIELNQREQLNLGIDLWCQGIRALAPLFDDVDFYSVLCNHGEWTRTGPGTRPVTSDSDNVGGFLAEAVQKVLAGRPGTDHVQWHIPRSEMTIMGDLSGVPVAFTHGHKMPGSAKEVDWLRGQSLRLLRKGGTEPRLWMTAHRHHLDVKDFGAWSRIQHTTLDHGSKWFEDTTGMWSTPGTVTMLVGQHEQAGERFYSDLQVV